jgi:hypothetical protein
MPAPFARLKSALIVFLAAAGLSGASTFLYLQYSLRGNLEQAIGERVGADARVGFAHIGLFPWRIQLNSIAIRNPEGFDESHFIKARHLQLRIARYSRSEKLIRSPQMTIDGMDVWVERQGLRSNTGVIQANLRRFDRAHAVTRADKTKFIIRELRIRGLKAHLRLQSASTTADIPDIVLRNVGASRGGGTIGELAGIVTQAAIRAALRVEAAERLGRSVEEGARKLERKLGELFD